MSYYKRKIFYRKPTIFEPVKINFDPCNKCRIIQFDNKNRKKKKF